MTRVTRAPLRCPELPMLGSGKTGTPGTRATAGLARRKLIYQRHAAALYRQALLMLGDPALAETVVGEVIADELMPYRRQGSGEDEIRYRLVQSVFQRCQRPDGLPAQRPSEAGGDRIDPGGVLSETERGALGLVLCGGLGYVQASTVLGIGEYDMAALLRSALRRLATSSAAAGGGQV
jgi:hypothetical protein